ncbi:hypothetical protein BX661DRAFT_188751 [Kickxella alabastrina]|uniref:uncharacterized protein n=1 Tax=Kickxella alabastrina TaxID=61397 RepID=UPI00221E5C14|nr:uncharacterized protein BX661DRAFT_188751 [Kickxella alabastrina]KAI7820895.1 hypothetical protein BX661DRAFT_188751 [Kickxella alabastrina]
MYRTIWGLLSSTASAMAWCSSAVNGSTFFGSFLRSTRYLLHMLCKDALRSAITSCISVSVGCLYNAQWSIIIWSSFSVHVRRFALFFFPFGPPVLSSTITDRSLPCIKPAYHFSVSLSIFPPLGNGVFEPDCLKDFNIYVAINLQCWASRWRVWDT